MLDRDSKHILYRRKRTYASHVNSPNPPRTGSRSSAGRIHCLIDTSQDFHISRLAAILLPFSCPYLSSNNSEGALQFFTFISTNVVSNGDILGRASEELTDAISFRITRWRKKVASNTVVTHFYTTLSGNLGALKQSAKTPDIEVSDSLINDGCLSLSHLAHLMLGWGIIGSFGGCD